MLLEKLLQVKRMSEIFLIWITSLELTPIFVFFLCLTIFGLFITQSDISRWRSFAGSVGIIIGLIGMSCVMLAPTKEASEKLLKLIQDVESAPIYTPPALDNLPSKPLLNNKQVQS